MSNIAFTEIVNKIHALPSLPAVVMQLLGGIGQNNADINQLSAIVSKDQALSAKALRLANSSFYGMQRKVTTMPQAVSHSWLEQSSYPGYSCGRHWPFPEQEARWF